MTAHLITDEQVRRVLRLADLHADNPDAWPLPSALDPREQLSMLLANLPRVEDGRLTINDVQVQAAMAAWDLHRPDPDKELLDNLHDAMRSALRAVGITVEEDDR
ncbi:hypothetical protein [Nesterenkonia suensis]